MTEREQFDLIDRYFRGELSASEMETFQGLLASDNEFAEAVTNHEAVNEFIVDAGLLEIKEKLQTYTGNTPSSTVKQPVNTGFFRNNAFKLMTGALIVTLCGIALGIWFSPPSSEKAGNDKRSSDRNPVVKKPDDNPNDPSKSSGHREKDLNEKQPKVEDNFPTSKPLRGNNEGKAANNKNEAYSSTINHIQRSGSYFGEISIRDLKVVNEPLPAPKTRIQLSKSLEQGLISRNCNEVNITGEVEKVPTCKEKANGKLKIKTNTIKGGKEPYQYSFSANSDFSKKAIKKHLNRGRYTVKVKDRNGCVETIARGIRINEEKCGSRSFTFVPEKETHWEYPFEQESPSGEIKIYYEGRQVYQERVNQGLPKTWRGNFNNGRKAPMGLYRITFNPRDSDAKMWLLTVIR